jgi:1-acyl-sn-glycerol-3-phosphate acyltransferase
MEPIYRFTRTLLKPSLHTWFKWHLEGLENIPLEGPAIVAFNHIAYLDPLAAAYVLDKRKRKPRFLAKQELFDDKKIGWILRGCHQIPVHRGTSSAPMALDNALSALEQGETVVIFPEGTITTDPELNPMEGKTGLARLALASKAPVIPCAVWGTANIWPKGYGAHWSPGQDILARVGEPMHFHGDPESRDDWKRVMTEVMDRITLLVASLRPAIPDRRRPKGKSAA